MSDRWAEFRGLPFIPSRMPVLDALVAFIPAGEPIRPAVTEDGPLKLLCSACKARMDAEEGGKG